MAVLWKKIDEKLVQDLLNNAPFVRAVEGEVDYLVTKTSVKSMLIDFVEKHMESYELKDES